jgi:hypothetical protein
MFMLFIVIRGEVGEVECVNCPSIYPCDFMSKLAASEWAE